MSLDPSWMSSTQKDVYKHFSNYDLGVPWEFDRSVDGDKVSLSFLEPSAKRINREEYIVTFKVRLVCTVSTEGLYDLAELSGPAAALLIQNIVAEEFCASPLNEEIDIELFDFKSGYKQALMEQVYSTRLRGST